MAKSFDELTARTMTKEARERAKDRAFEMLAEMFLRELRRAKGLTQAELAKRLHIKQPSLSKLESHGQDMQVTTLRRIVNALGGELDISARFPDRVVRLKDFKGATRVPVRSKGTVTTKGTTRARERGPESLQFGN
jgi:transcriptional regulator with XRE-family HTH domain